MSSRMGIKTTVKIDNPIDIQDFFTDEPVTPVGTIIGKKRYPPDHTDPIWDYLWKVKLPIIATRSVESLKARGFNKTGIKSIDDNVHKQIFYPHISIDIMLDVEDNGYGIVFTNEDDALEIYNILGRYQTFWDQLLASGGDDIHQASIGPTKDLKRLQQFRSSIYPIVKHRVMEQAPKGLMGLMSNLINPHANTVNTDQVEAPSIEVSGSKGLI